MINKDILFEKIKKNVKKENYALLFNSCDFEDLVRIRKIIEEEFRIYNTEAWNYTFSNINIFIKRGYKSAFLEFRKGKIHFFATSSNECDGDEWYLKKENIKYETIDIKEI